MGLQDLENTFTSSGWKCELRNGKKVIYATSEKFYQRFYFKFKNGSLDKFHEKYRNCDVLLIDDVQF